MSTLAIDLGGSNLRAALWDGMRLTALLHAPAPQSREGFIETLESLLQIARPAQLGLAIPGLAKGLICHWVPNLPWLDGFGLDHFGLPCALGNDAQLALLAEAERGAAQGAQSALLLALGTGIGSAVLAGGQVLQGAACSFGWAAADTADLGHPAQGWLERQASGRALDGIARGLGLPDGAALIEAERRDGPLPALTPVAEALGTSLAGAVALLGLEKVLLSGGVSRAFDVLGPRMMPVLLRHLPPHLQGVEVHPAAFGAEASLMGAALAGAGSRFWTRA